MMENNRIVLRGRVIKSFAVLGGAKIQYYNHK